MTSAPLDDTAVITTVQLLYSAPDFMPESAATLIGRIFSAARKTGAMTAALAIWPDGTWAMLGHDPDWPQPRPEQLVRAYRNAYAAGIRLPHATLTLRSA